MRKVVLMILSLFVLSVSVNAAGTSNFNDVWHSKKVINKIKKSIQILKNDPEAPWKSDFKKHRVDIGIRLLAETKVYGNYLETRYGKLQNTIINLQLPTGIISSNLTWHSLLYNADKYLQSSRDAYEYYYRTYQLFSLRLFLRGDINPVCKGETESGLTIDFVNIYFTDSRFWRGYEKDNIYSITSIYGAGSNPNFKRKAYFNFILFVGTMLNDLGNKTYAKKYFSKYERDWAKMRNLLNQLKEEDNQK